MLDPLETTPAACRRILAIADRDPRRAASLAQRALARAQGDALPVAYAQHALGYALLCWERFDAARSQLQAAMATFVARGRELPALRCRYALLLADLLQFARPDLEQDLVFLAAQFDAAGSSIESARCRLYRAVLFNVLGRPSVAERALDEIADVVMMVRGLDQGRWLRVRGAAAIGLGAHARAQELLQQAEQIFQAAHSPLELAKTWFEQAKCALRLEQLDPAMRGYQRAERVFARIDLPLRRAFCATGLGLLLARRGAYDQALRATLGALAYFTELRRTVDMAACQLNLGGIYFYVGLWDAALACYGRAEELYAAAGELSESRVARRNRAIVYRIQWRFAEAQQLLDEIEAALGDDSGPSERAAIWLAQAELLASTGQVQAAMARFWQARDYLVAIGNWLEAGDCAVEQGRLALDQGDTAQALAHFQFAAPLVTQHPYDRWRAAYGLARCAEAAGDTARALEHYRAAGATVATLRGRLASEAASSGLYAQAARLHADALRLAVASGADELALAIGEDQRALVLQRLLAVGLGDLSAADRAEHDRLRAAISSLLVEGAARGAPGAAALDAALAAYGELLLHARHGAYAADRAEALPAHSFDLASTRAALGEAYGDDWTALSYVTSGDRLLITVVTMRDVTVEQVAFDADLERLIARATQPRYRRYTYADLAYLQGQATRPWDTLRALAERLVPAVVRARLGPNHHLLIVPAGPLHALPWAALRLEDSWLAQRAIVTIAPSLAAWRLLAGRTAAHGDAALLVGCAEFGGRAPALPMVAEELAAVAERWAGPATQLRDARVTRAALLDRSAAGELARYALLHFATHARMLPSSGLAAHLRLSDDELLLPEVLGLRLGGGLVVLSTCEGAAADALPGEEVLSLSWAFLAAGACGVLASLWRIDDRAAARVMVAFYEELRAHRDASLALAYAQRRLIAEGEAAQGEPGPEWWGSLVLTGDGRLRE